MLYSLFLRFVRIQDKLNKAVSSLDFFTSRSWVFSTDNLFMLNNLMTSEDRKVCQHFQTGYVQARDKSQTEWVTEFTNKLVDVFPFKSS